MKEQIPPRPRTGDYLKLSYCSLGLLCNALKCCKWIKQDCCSRHLHANGEALEELGLQVSHTRTPRDESLQLQLMTRDAGGFNSVLDLLHQGMLLEQDVDRDPVSQCGQCGAVIV